MFFSLKNNDSFQTSLSLVEGMMNMERTMSVEEKIRKAEEIYYRRRNQEIFWSYKTMINYVQTNILDMIEYVGEDNCQNILSSFVCPLNPDVEDFIRTKAITFAKQRIAVSYLVFAEQSEQNYFVGYYTLANKFVCVNGSALSKTMQKKIAKFSQYDPASERFMVSMPLIAQLGKNFNPELPIKMS